MADEQENQKKSGAAELLEKLVRDPSGLSLLIIHAHPDDETLATGPFIAGLSRSGARIDVVTCTRGERGEVIPGALPAGISTEDLVVHREQELAAAGEILGVQQHWFLGEIPWRASGLRSRRYEDSGMEWITSTLAGPAADASAMSFTSCGAGEEIADLMAGLSQGQWDGIISYDDGGGYGHPDHVRAHHIALKAAQTAGIAFIQLVSSDDARIGGEQGLTWLPNSDSAVKDLVARALACYRSQLAVVDLSDKSVRVRHVGGQYQEIPLETGLYPG